MSKFKLLTVFMWIIVLFHSIFMLATGRSIDPFVSVASVLSCIIYSVLDLDGGIK